MKPKLFNYLVKYVLLSNGNEYPREVHIMATGPDHAWQLLSNDVILIGTCDFRIVEIITDK